LPWTEALPTHSKGGYVGPQPGLSAVFTLNTVSVIHLEKKGPTTTTQVTLLYEMKKVTVTTMKSSTSHIKGNYKIYMLKDCG
jgi:hypothetical protein